MPKEPKVLRLLAEFACWPTWDYEDAELTENYGPVDPNTLPISDSLKLDVIEWNREYQKLLDWSDPGSSGFKSTKTERSFYERGRVLADKIAQQMNNTIVVYTDGITGRNIRIS